MRLLVPGSSMVVVYQRCINAWLDFVANPFLPFRFERRGSRRKVKAWCTPRRPGVYVVRGRTTGQKVTPTRTHPAALAPLRPRCPRTATTAMLWQRAMAAIAATTANARTLYRSMPTPGPPARRSPRTGGWYFQLPTTVFSRSLRHRAPRKPTPINKVVALPLTALPLCDVSSVERGLAVGEAAKLGLLNGAGAPFEGVRAHASVCACCSYVRRVV